MKDTKSNTFVLITGNESQKVVTSSYQESIETKFAILL